MNRILTALTFIASLLVAVSCVDLEIGSKNPKLLYQLEKHIGNRDTGPNRYSESSLCHEWVNKTGKTTIIFMGEPVEVDMNNEPYSSFTLEQGGTFSYVSAPGEEPVSGDGNIWLYKYNCICFGYISNGYLYHTSAYEIVSLKRDELTLRQIYEGGAREDVRIFERK